MGLCSTYGPYRLDASTSGLDGCGTLPSGTSPSLAVLFPVLNGLLYPGLTYLLWMGCEINSWDACKSQYAYDLVAADGSSVALGGTESPLAYDDGLGGCYRGCSYPDNQYWTVHPSVTLPTSLAPGSYTFRVRRTIEWCPGATWWCSISGHRYDAGTLFESHVPVSIGSIPSG